MSLDAGDTLRSSDTFAFFRGLNTDKSSGRRDVPLSSLVAFIAGLFVSSEDVRDIVVLTQAAYDALTPVATTQYLIVG